MAKGPHAERSHGVVLFGQGTNATIRENRRTSLWLLRQARPAFQLLRTDTRPHVPATFTTNVKVLPSIVPLTCQQPGDGNLSPLT
jgi:hypothetical protein